MTRIILDEKFWNDVFVVVKIVGPLICLLRLVDFDEMPAFGYVYEGMHKACEGIKEIFSE